MSDRHGNSRSGDPWSVEYHQMGRARLNPDVCTCGLGPSAVVHNEPPHRFNGRPKAGMPPVYGICTDCHHHETSSCHTTTVTEGDVPAPAAPVIEPPGEAVILAARHLDPIEGRAQLGMRIDGVTFAAISQVVDYVAKAYNARRAD